MLTSGVNSFLLLDNLRIGYRYDNLKSDEIQKKNIKNFFLISSLNFPFLRKVKVRDSKADK